MTIVDCIVATYLRKVDRKGWLTDADKHIEARVSQGLKQFCGDDKPSVYHVTSKQEMRIATAALAWNRWGREIDRIKKTDAVLITDEHLRAAGLQAVRDDEGNYIAWSALQKRHFVLTVNGSPCTEEDLGELVSVLIEQHAEHVSFKAEELKREAAEQTAQTETPSVLGRVVSWCKRILGLG